MLKKMTVWVMIASLTICNLGMVGSAWAQEDEDDDKDAQFVRTISSAGGDGWQIVDVRKVDGTEVILSPVVGEEIDLEESNRFALFQGRTIYTNKIDLPVLRMGVSGFQSAVFMMQANGKPAIKIEFRSGPHIETRLVGLRGADDLRLLREYIEHFHEVIKEEYTIGVTSSIAEDAEFPKFTEKPVSFEERRPRFPVRFRMPGQVTLKDGKKIKGEFVPVYEDGQILMETDLSIQKIPVDDIERIQFHGERGSDALGQAIVQGIGGAAMGALTGAFAAWQANADVKETAIWAAAIFGVFGFVTGLIRGARATRSGETFDLGPVEGGHRR